MKKYIFVIAFVITATNFLQAQTPPVKIPSTSSSGFDVKSLTSGIMGKLAPLALTAVQNPKVTGIVSDFLTKKSGIIGLATSKPAEYATKFAGLNSGMLSSMKGILSATQYTKFLGMKPKTNDPTNALSQLFY